MLPDPNSKTVAVVKYLYPEVEALLKREPKLRDDDIGLFEALALDLYARRLGAPLADVQLSVLVADIRRGIIPTFETVARVRRLLQEEKPELRGEKWAKRHGEAELTRTAAAEGRLL